MIKMFMTFGIYLVLNNYNNYSLSTTREYLNDYIKKTNIWKMIGDGLLVHDYLLEPTSIKLKICHTYSEGAYLPNSNEVSYIFIYIYIYIIYIYIYIDYFVQ